MQLWVVRLSDIAATITGVQKIYMYTPGFGKDAGSAHTCFLSATVNPIDDDEKLPYGN